MDRPSPLIETEALTCRFGSMVAVASVDMSVAAGEVFGLVGRNGAGKSTLIKMLVTLLAPSSGRARVAGFDVVRQARSVRAAFGYVPQMLSADRSLTARENLLLSARLYLIPRPQCHGRVEAALELLVMDEPTVGLDPVARHAMWERIRRIRAGGTAILITSHLMEEIEALCDRVGILHQGRLVAAGTPGELETRVGPGAGMNEVFANLVGSDPMGEGADADVRRNRRSTSAHS